MTQTNHLPPGPHHAPVASPGAVAAEPPSRGSGADTVCQRSPGLEWLGLISGALFFIGLFFAYRTFTAGLVTQAEFDSLQVGLTLQQVNDRLGFAGRQRGAAQEPARPGADGDHRSSQTTSVYRWENSTQSWVACQFEDGRLTRMWSRQLP